MSTTSLPTSPPGRWDEQLARWLGVAGFDDFVLHPRLDGRGGVTCPDAIARSPAGLCILEVWWHPDLPRRNPNTGSLERVADGHPIVCRDPASCTCRAERTIEAHAEQAHWNLPAITRVVIAPLLASEHAGALARTLEDDEIVVVVGQPPEMRPLLTPSGREVTEDMLWRWVSRRPGERLSDHSFTQQLSELQERIEAFLEEQGHAPKAKDLRERRRSRAEPVIALLGTFSSGKTTLLNSLAGPYLFPVKDTPTTVTRVQVSWGDRFRADVLYHERSWLEKVKARAGKLADRFAGQARQRFKQTVDAIDLDHADAGARRPVGSWETLSALVQNNDVSVYIKDVSVNLPVERLRGVHLVDLPGTDSHIPWHREVVERAVGEIDGLVYCFRAAQAYGQADSQLLHQIATHLRLSETSRALFLVNYIDEVRPRERDAVLAYVEGLLHREFGMDRPRVAPTSLILAEAEYQLGRPRPPDGYLEACMDAREQMGLRPDATFAEGRARSGIVAVERFLDDARVSRRLHLTRSWLETARRLLKETEDLLDTKHKALGASGEKAAEVLRHLGEARSALREIFQDAAYEQKQLEEGLDNLLQKDKLEKRWVSVIDCHTGKVKEGRAALERVSREWVEHVAQQTKLLVRQYLNRVHSRADEFFRNLCTRANGHVTDAANTMSRADEAVQDALTFEMDWHRALTTHSIRDEREKVQEKAAFRWERDLVATLSEKLDQAIESSIGEMLKALFAAIWKKMGDWWADLRDKQIPRLRKEFNDERATTVVGQVAPKVKVFVEIEVKQIEKDLHNRVQTLERQFAEALTLFSGSAEEVAAKRGNVSSRRHLCRELGAEAARLLGEL